jgi:diguanylate cyclase (GGDEF)-like protein
LPEYVKINHYFTHGVDEDPIKLNFVNSIQNIASTLDCHVIAEGIETKEELKAIAKLGVTHAQGYYFSKPVLAPLDTIDSALFANNQHEENEAFDPFNTTKAVSHITKRITPASSNTSISEIMVRFQHNSHLTILPLVDDNIAVGIIYRDQFLSKLFASRYGLELYGKKAIKLFIDKVPLSIDHNVSIQTVSKKLTSMLGNEGAFIITQNGEYAGIATVMDLLEEITYQQIESAKHANPLTLLPGSVPINKQINQFLAQKTPFSVAYFDLDNFKPYNDVYGYDAGDNIIKAVAKTLLEYVPAEKGMVGHIGGDDFIVIFTCEDWLQCCKNILKAFKNEVPNHYKAKDVKAGGIHTENRNGQKCFYPVTSLSVGAIDAISTAQCQSHIEIADLAAGAKKQAKKIEGNSCFVNKRVDLGL